jgi:2-oxoglutarate dehydrogenase E2 component (dihydrolipoamide succinyltransferase)
MIIEVKVPQLSESVAEATLSAWHVKEGDAVARDQNLIDIETDKVVLELPAPDAGVIVKIIKQNGESVASGEVIAQIDTEAKAAAARLPPPSRPRQPGRPGRRGHGHAGRAQDHGRKGHRRRRRAGQRSWRPHSQGRRQRRSQERSAGPGKSRRVASADFCAARPALPQPGVVNADAIIADRPEQRVPMTRLRARVAERLVQSQSTNAILTTFNEVNMAPVMEMRKKYQDKFEKEHGVKLGFMSFFVKAAVAALKKYPVLNASVDGNDIVYHGYFDIGIAVGSPRGLVVPILRDADQMSLAQIEKKIAEFGPRPRTARSRSRNSPAAPSRSPTAACSARCCRRRSSTRRSRPSSACMPPRTEPWSRTARS